MCVPETAESDLFEDVNEIINHALDVANYRTRTAALQLAKDKDCDVDGERLVGNVFERLNANWSKVTGRLVRKASVENFRWFKPQAQIGQANPSAEVMLERAFISGCLAAGRTDWSNQVPLISGVAGSSAYKRWAIDLVHQRPDGFEFVELKIKGDTPLSATMQVIQYGMLWLLSRNDRHRLGYGGNPILEAPALHLSVLAPLKFYERVRDDRLARAIGAGLSVLGRQHGVALSFSQTAFPPSFQWPSAMSGNELVAAVEARQVL